MNRRTEKKTANEGANECLPQVRYLNNETFLHVCELFVYSKVRLPHLFTEPEFDIYARNVIRRT